MTAVLKILENSLGQINGNKIKLFKMKKYILYFLVSSVMIGCVTSKKNYFIEVEEVDKSILRVSPKDSASFELIFVNNSDKDVILGGAYFSYDIELLIYDSQGNQLKESDGLGCSYRVVKPGGKVVVTENIATVIQIGLKRSKLDEHNFGKYTLIWKPSRLRLNPDFKDLELKLDVTYDQGDIDYLRDIDKRAIERLRNKRNEINNKNK